MFPETSLNQKIKIRVLIINLSTGEKEILITSLMDQDKYKYEIFKELYHLRWSGERTLTQKCPKILSESL